MALLYIATDFFILELILSPILCHKQQLKEFIFVRTECNM